MEGKEQAEWRVTDCALPECEVNVVVIGLPDDDGPRIRVSPEELDFSTIPVDADVEGGVAIENIGGRPLRIDRLTVEGPGFSTDPWTVRTLSPGAIVPWPVTFRALGTSTQRGTLRVESDDPAFPETTVRLIGRGVILPPCDYTVSPGVLSFGRVPLFRTELKSVTVSNGGDEECLVFDIRITPNGDTPPGTFRLPDAPIPSQTLLPGETFDVNVAFRADPRWCGTCRAAHADLEHRPAADRCSAARRGRVGSRASVLPAADDRRRPVRPAGGHGGRRHHCRSPSLVDRFGTAPAASERRTNGIRTHRMPRSSTSSLCWWAGTASKSRSPTTKAPSKRARPSSPRRVGACRQR